MTVQQRKKAHEFDQRILEIFDGYVHGNLTKRQFISQAGKYAAAGVTGAMILEQLQPNYAWAEQVAPVKWHHQLRKKHRVDEYN